MMEITVYPKQVRGTIDANVYGLHLEHIWTCVYPCIWVGRDSKVPNIEGIRKDVVKLLAGLRPAVCKYPGGYFSDFYDWRDGVGKSRPIRVCPTQPGRRESNQFGTAEFATLCRLIGAEPFISVSTTCLLPNEAAQWVEYCNVTGDVFWAARRRKDGHKNPFRVRHWAIGNEQYWLHSAREYADRYKLWAHWMYNADPDITLVMSGIEPGIDGLACDPWNTDGKWGEDVLRLTKAGQGLIRGDWHPLAGNRNILYSIHPYFSANATCSDREYYDTFAELDERLRRSIRLTIKFLDKYRGKYPRPRLCFDEYGLLHSGISMAGNMTQPAPFWAALWLGCFLHICHEYPADVGMATLPGMINMEHALILMENGRAIATPSYYAFKMLRPHGGAEAVKVAVKNNPTGRGSASNLLRVLASKGEDGRVTLSLINLHLEKSVEVKIGIGSGIEAVRGQVLTGLLHARNSFKDPTCVLPVAVEPNITGGRIVHRLPARSLTVLEISLR